MNLRRILAILTKDLRDAWRDGRIVILLVIPIGLALIPSLGGEDERPTTQVAVVEPGNGAVARELRAAAGKGIDIELKRARDLPSARRLVADGDAELAIVVAPVSRPQPPRAEILVAQNATPAAQAVVPLVPDVLARAAGRSPAAQTHVQAVAPKRQSPVEVIGPAALSVLLAMLVLVTFVAMIVVPIQTAEELETGTFGALRLAATGREILAAKAIAGFVYGSVGVGLMVVLTGLAVADPLQFSAAVVGLIASLVGFGLLLGLLIPNANAINTYGGLLVTVFIGLGVAVFLVEPGPFATILDLLPISQAAKLLGNGVSGEAPLDTGPVSWLVIAVWAIVGYGALARIASRREL
jgi:ABC-type multidrug transport system permease subunit